eukprot:748985-Pyramimonas_sp.AAC.1
MLKAPFTITRTLEGSSCAKARAWRISEQTRRISDCHAATRSREGHQKSTPRDQREPPDANLVFRE